MKSLFLERSVPPVNLYIYNMQHSSEIERIKRCGMQWSLCLTFSSSAILSLQVFCTPRLMAIFAIALFSQSFTIALARPCNSLFLPITINHTQKISRKKIWLSNRIISNKGYIPKAKCGGTVLASLRNFVMSLFLRPGLTP